MKNNCFKHGIFLVLILCGLFSKSHAQENTENGIRAIFVDNREIENFEKECYKYDFYLPYTYNSIPELKLATDSPNAVFSVENIKNIHGAETERTAVVKILSDDETLETAYYITFTVLPKLDLFLCIGQSNMAGRGTLDEEKGDLIPVDNAFLLTPSGQWEKASNPMNKYSSIRKDLLLQQMSPSYMFAKKVTEKTGRQIGLVVNARGGSSIDSWKKGHSDKFYDEALKRALEAEKWGEFKAIVWHQGESNSSKATEYVEKLKNLVSDLRSDLKNSKLYFVAGELAYWRENGTESTPFNNMIRTISSFVSNSGWVSAENLSPLINETDPHFDRNSQLILGKRYSDNILTNVYKLSSIANDDLDNNQIEIQH